jgi:hypothetical protein
VQDAGRTGIGRGNNAVVHPFALAPGPDNAGAPQIGQMARDRRLAYPQNLNQKADTDLVLTDQVEQSQPGAISQHPKQILHVYGLPGFAHKAILAWPPIICQWTNVLANTKITFDLTNMSMAVKGKRADPLVIVIIVLPAIYVTLWTLYFLGLMPRKP